jgi:hypothetical protein
MTLGILATVLSVSASAAFRSFLSSDPGSYESFGSQYQNYLFIEKELTPSALAGSGYCTTGILAYGQNVVK